jgi:hypothetical protein
MPVPAPGPEGVPHLSPMPEYVWPTPSAIVRASGQAALAVNNALAVPHLGEEATYAIGGAMLFARVGARFVPYVGIVISGLEVFTWGWSLLAPWVAAQLEAQGI